MIKLKLSLSGLGILFVSLITHGQGFVNLGFESAQLSPVPAGQFGGEVSSLSAIPGWTASLDGSPITQIIQNNGTGGDASVDILGPSWNVFGIIEGQYMIVLQPGEGLSGNVSASISQTGLVPANTQSLEFKASVSSSITVNLEGQNLSLVPLGTGSATTLHYTIYGANIPLSDVGQVEPLTITALAAPNTADYFDSFAFSSSSVPEPNITILIMSAFIPGGLRKLKIGTRRNLS